MRQPLRCHILRVVVTRAADDSRWIERSDYRI